jgi:hypothetical protein
MSKKYFFGFLVFLGLGILTLNLNSVSADKKIVVGANLKEYHQPRGKKCDINVPADYSTIQSAVNSSIEGNTICVAPGTYNENIEIHKQLRLSGAGDDKSIIIGQSSATSIYIGGDGSADNTIVEGFSIIGPDSLNENRNDETVINIGPFSTGVVVRHNRITTGFATLAIRADSGQNNDQIYNNLLVGNSSPELVKVSGVQGPAGIVDILNNTFSGSVEALVPNISGSGVVLDTFANNSKIDNNTFNVIGNINVLISSAYATNLVNLNNLESISGVKVGTYSGGNLNAENNWWGDTDPSDNIHGDVDYTPFATNPFAEY